MTDTANLGLPCIEAAQAQKHVTHNEALRMLDTLVQLAVLDRDLTAPPGSPSEGQRWIVKRQARPAPGPDMATASPPGRTAAGGSARRRPAGSPTWSTRARCWPGPAAPGSMPSRRSRRSRNGAARRRHHGGRDQSVQRQAQQHAVGRRRPSPKAATAICATSSARRARRRRSRCCSRTIIPAAPRSG